MIKLNMKKAKSFALLLLAFLIIAIPFYGCQNSEVLKVDTTKTGEYPVTVNNVEFASQPQKVVVLSPSLADVVLALNCERYLTAASVECEQSELEILTKISSTDTQAITDTGADLILTEPLDDETRQAYSGLGITILEVQLATTRENFESLYAQVATAMLGDGYGYDTGIQTARDIFITMDIIERETKRDILTTACYLYDAEGRGVTGDQFGTLILEYAGLTNVLAEDKNSTYDLESFYKVYNPEIIFCDLGQKEEIMAKSEFSDIPAVKNDRVYELDKSYMEWQGRTVINGATKVAEMAFPELTEAVSNEVPDPTSKIESAVETEMSSLVSSEDEASGSEGSNSSENSESSESSENNTAYETLEYGDSGDEVYKLQERLTELGYLETEYDGEFGDYTETALKEFQKENSLTETGIADSATQQKLFSDEAASKP